MSYETIFTVEYTDNKGNRFNKDLIKSSIVKTLNNNYEKIEKKNLSKEEKINDWINFIFDNDYKYVSMSYENLNLLIEIGKQFIIDNITDKVNVVFEWDGEEGGDYTKNLFVLKKKNNTISIKKNKKIYKMVEIDVDLNDKIYRD